MYEKTIIHLLIDFGSGGAEHFVLELAKQNKLQGYKVHVVSISSINKIEDKFKQAGVDIIYLNINGLGKVFQGFKQFLKIINDGKKTLIHAHMFHAGMFASLAKFLRPSVPVVFTLHNDHVKQSYRKYLLFLTKALRFKDIIFSEASKKWYQKSDAVTIPNGIDISRFNIAHQPSEQFTCLFIGRLEEQKNPFYLIDLVLLIKDEHYFKIRIVGEGKFKEQLQAKIAEHKIENYFDFLGYRKDIPELFSTSNCFIMPSLWEGMPISLLEAGAAGVPVLSTPVGSITSIINSTNGYLSELKTFHVHLKEIISHYDDALKKAKNLKSEVINNYNIIKNAQKHEGIYQKTMP